MNNFTVCLFGHREINDLRKLNNGICAVINELMHEKDFPSMRIGSRLIVPKEKFKTWVDEKTGK